MALRCRLLRLPKNEEDDCARYLDSAGLSHLDLGVVPMWPGVRRAWLSDP